MTRPGRVSRARVWASAIAVLSIIAAAAAPGQAASSSPWDSRKLPSIDRISEAELVAEGSAGGSEGLEQRAEILNGAQSYAAPRFLPGTSVDAAALKEARLQVSALQVAGGSWREVTTKPYNADDPNYRDPYISNSGGGWGLVTGRMSAIATDGARVYVGGADGGVWRSTDGGGHFRPLTDGLPSTSTGALAVNRADHSVWLGTGEANTAFENYLGVGMYVSKDGGDSWRAVGGAELENSMISRIAFDGRGNVLISTSSGIWRRSTSAPRTDPWTLVLRPGTPGPYGFTFGNDVQVRPGTRGQEVVANIAWRGGHTDYNGFYESDRGGRAGTWRYVRPRGIPAGDIGRASLAYAADGTTLYTVVESIQKYTFSSETALLGVFESPSGNIEGPWIKRANSATLAQSGSALRVGEGYGPGIQAWYNQFIGVDPADASHVYLGLEEVYESSNSGQDWNTIGPYWNFTLPCAQNGLDSCPMTTHPDQHAVAFGQGQVWIGNDGGIYSRALAGGTSWRDRNATLRTLQYYGGGIGKVDGADAYWGGLQDNGSSYLPAGSSTMVSPFGGDGGQVIVDPNDGTRTVQEYVLGDMWLTTNAGASDGSTFAWDEITPSCYAFTYAPDPCDPNPRFIAPFVADVNDVNHHWVFGGQYVWESTSGWDTSCGSGACDWSIVHNTGSGNTTTALAVNGDTIYAGYCAAGCNPGPAFYTGIDTNYGGTWHTIAGPTVSYAGATLPQRYVFNITVDPSDAGHVYAIYSGYSRRWIPGAGVGHVFESNDGGDTWTDISGNLPDAPADDLLLVDGTLVLATDVGVFSADASDPGTWSRFGSGLPNAVANELVLSPDGSYILGVTHGRGMWKVAAP